MIQKIFGVYDSKACAFLQPFFSVSNGAAIRAFVRCVCGAYFTTAGMSIRDAICPKCDCGEFGQMICSECGKGIEVVEVLK